MSGIIIVTARMNKIASVDIKMKYRQPGNVVAYIFISFEVYKKRSKFFVIPNTNDANKILVNLPNEFSFRLENDSIYISAPRLEEVVEEIVDKLNNLGFIAVSEDNCSVKKRVYLAEALEFF
ncbi:MAG: hypothetical protein JWR87_3175 [Segetibacter sp.]|jgi:hypothetical protein|nr:hypothetical protein [Segetibacter sp.]